MRTNYKAEIDVDRTTGQVKSLRIQFRSGDHSSTEWRSWGCNLDFDKNDRLLGAEIFKPVARSKLAALTKQLGKDGQFLMATIPNGLLLAEGS
jgi:hypothetical protein